MRIKSSLLTFSLVFFSLSFTGLYANDFAGIALRVNGAAHVTRDGERKALEKDTILKSGDLIEIGEGASYADLQLSPQYTCRLAAGTSVSIDTLQQSAEGRRIEMRMSSGSVAGKLIRGDEEHQVNIATPTTIAGVRGTEFIVDASEEESTVLVNEGSVEVSAAESGQSQTVEAGNKIVSDGQELQMSIMEQFDEARFEILQQFEDVRRQNFEFYVDQVRRNQEAMEQFRR